MNPKRVSRAATPEELSDLLEHPPRRTIAAKEGAVTIRISLGVVAFVVHTLALLGGAFGISLESYSGASTNRKHEHDMVKFVAQRAA